ncbi:hypothetical protein T06_14506 [Trichinella sp. T6]|nr:hypothetical protein T06_14506 [Trichinella sp. T6]
MEKKNALKRRAAEEMKTVPQINHEEASSVSADLETAGQFPTYKSVKTVMYRRRVQKFPRLPPTRQNCDSLLLYDVAFVTYYIYTTASANF